MKRFAGTTAAVVFTALLAGHGVAAGISVRVSGALNRISYGDFNDAAEYVNKEVLWASGSTGEVGAIRWIPEFGAEVLVSVVPRLSIGAGAGVMYGASSFMMRTTDGSFSYKHSMRAYPVTATAYVDLPLLPFAKPYLCAGIGAYGTKLTFEESTSSAWYTGTGSAELDTWGFGFHGGAGLSFGITPTVQFELGVEARRAVVKGFEGERRNPDGTATAVYLASYSDATGAVSFAPESMADKGAFSEGSVDLSGISFILGFTASF